MLFFNLYVVIILSFVIIMSMYLVSCFLSFKEFVGNKLSAYECGFDIIKKVHYNFSIVFFSIILLFVVFELEVIIFIILIQVDVFSMLVFFLFMLYVILSFYMEWYLGSLVWKI